MDASNRTASRVRAFVVGCPRSGTTLLQAQLALHAPLATLPETHLLCDLPEATTASSASTPPLEARLQEAIDWMREASDEETTKHLATRFAETAVESTVGDVIASFVEKVDRYAAAARERGWVEKTPDHFMYVSLIRETVADAKFIHITRAPVDVIASLRTVTARYPDAWEGRWSVSRCVDAWARASDTARTFAGAHDYLTVAYEDLCADPSAVLQRVTDFLGVDFDAEGRSPDDLSAPIILETEPWKTRSLRPVGEHAPVSTNTLTPDELDETRRQLAHRGYTIDGSRLHALSRLRGAFSRLLEIGRPH